jgi:hypothetical protein
MPEALMRARRRTGRSKDDLIHPDSEAIAADYPDCNERPDQDGEYKERE